MRLKTYLLCGLLATASATLPLTLSTLPNITAFCPPWS
jgi:hypothetical protein